MALHEHFRNQASTGEIKLPLTKFEACMKPKWVVRVGTDKICSNSHNPHSYLRISIRISKNQQKLIKPTPSNMGQA
jgi:hypothetical protein